MFFFEKNDQKTFGHGLGQIMVTRHLAAASIIACLVFLSVAHAEVPAPNLLVLDDYGIYAAKVVKDIPAPGSNTGVTALIAEPQLLLHTHSICAHLGTQFGIKIRLRDGLPYNSLPVSVEIDHPALTNSHGQKQDRDDHDDVVYAGAAGWTGWLFRDPHNMIDGIWTFIIRHDGAELLRQSFDVRFSCAAPIA
jgi:hypothetical protein